MKEIDTNILLSKNREYLKVLEFLAEEGFVFYQNSDFDVIAKEKSNNRCYVNCICFRGYSNNENFCFTFVRESVSFYLLTNSFIEFKDAFSIRNEILTNELVKAFSGSVETYRLFRLEKGELFSIEYDLFFSSEFYFRYIVVFDNKPKMIVNITQRGKKSSFQEDSYKELCDYSYVASRFFSNKDVIFDFPDNAFPSKIITNNQVKEIKTRVEEWENKSRNAIIEYKKKQLLAAFVTASAETSTNSSVAK